MSECFTSTADCVCVQPREPHRSRGQVGQNSAIYVTTPFMSGTLFFLAETKKEARGSDILLSDVMLSRFEPFPIEVTVYSASRRSTIKVY